MPKCWERRACDEEMQENCPHPNELNDNCPTKCAFANACQYTAHKVTSDPGLVFDPSVDRTKAIKDTCLYCELFLKHGPRVA